MKRIGYLIALCLFISACVAYGNKYRWIIEDNNEWGVKGQGNEAEFMCQDLRLNIYFQEVNAGEIMGPFGVPIFPVKGYKNLAFILTYGEEIKSACNKESITVISGGENQKLAVLYADGATCTVYVDSSDKVLSEKSELIIRHPMFQCDIPSITIQKENDLYIRHAEWAK